MTRAIGRSAGPSLEGTWADDLHRERAPGPRLRDHRVLDDVGLSTASVHAGTYTDDRTGAVGAPIFQTTTFELSDDSYQAFAQGHLRDVPIYGRYGTPTQWSVQQKIASLEGTESALVFSSGMAAISTALLALTNRGGHIISSRDVYGGTYNLLREDFHQFGREVTFTAVDDIDQITAAIRDNTQVLFFETMTNPLLKALPLHELGEIAASHGLLLIIDNTLLTPYCLRPVDHGAQLVIHSASKYLGGHDDLTAGAIAGPRKIIDMVWSQMIKLGGSLDALDCFLLERGLKTLAIRMRAHVENGNAIARFLAGHDKVRRVHHPSAEDYPCPWIRTYCPNSWGGMVSFEVDGGEQAASRLIERVRIPRTAVSLGGVESLISLPSNTSHSVLAARQQREIGIRPGLVRLSAGIEDTADLINDLDHALGGV